jgi:uncharacterized protein (DUF1501 family)
MDRRSFVRGMCLGGLATFALPGVRFAQVPGRSRLVFVLLRGGVDGLAAVVPLGDPAYRAARGRLALDPDGLRPLDGTFSLAPGLAPLADFWDRDELLAVHGVAIPYRSRSHFDSQAVLETGLDRPSGSADGWLNRLLGVMGGEASGVAVAAGLPRSLVGPHPVTTWSPTRLGVVEDGYLERMALLYRADPELHDRFEAALQLQELSGAAADDESGPADRRDREELRRRGRFGPVLDATARFLREPDGPNVAAVELSGWDTHAAQGTAGGGLDRRLGILAASLASFREAMGQAWDDTTVVVLTEFGRTVAPNGSGGTDHGTAGAGFVLGPRVRRSAVVADWPGLAPGELFEGRDVRPTLDTRAVLKGVLAGVFDLTGRQADRVFPGSEGAPGRWDLMG